MWRQTDVGVNEGGIETLNETQQILLIISAFTIENAGVPQTLFMKNL